jgi:hypothetical protein
VDHRWRPVAVCGLSDAPTEARRLFRLGEEDDKIVWWWQRLVLAARKR